LLHCKILCSQLSFTAYEKKKLSISWDGMNKESVQSEPHPSVQRIMGGDTRTTFPLSRVDSMDRGME
jgi:hypothetical protein